MATRAAGVIRGAFIDYRDRAEDRRALAIDVGEANERLIGALPAELAAGLALARRWASLSSSYHANAATPRSPPILSSPYDLSSRE